MTSTLPRILEPEVMDTFEEAHDYDAMDHAYVNDRFCADLLADGAVGPRVLDVGTGTALIPIALLKRAPDLRIVGVDLAEQMLALGRQNVESAGLSARISLEKVDAKGLPYDDGSFDSVISNSIIHHIPEPGVALAEMIRVTRPGGLVFVRDLARPSTPSELDRLVDLYGGAKPNDPAKGAAFERQRGLFRDSLRAALTVSEVHALVATLGVANATTTTTSDRHWTLRWRKP